MLKFVGHYGKGLLWKGEVEHLAYEVEESPIDYEQLHAYSPRGNTGRRHRDGVGLWHYQVYGEAGRGKIRCAKASSISFLDRPEKAKRRMDPGPGFGVVM